MIDDVYQAALGALEHHLKQAGTAYTVDEGELLIGSHRLGLSIAFERFVDQGEHVLAPLDIQVHLDGDDGDRFRVGTLGVGVIAAPRWPRPFRSGICWRRRPCWRRWALD